MALSLELVGDGGASMAAGEYEDMGIYPGVSLRG